MRDPTTRNIGERMWMILRISQVFIFGQRFLAIFKFGLRFAVCGLTWIGKFGLGHCSEKWNYWYCTAMNIEQSLTGIITELIIFLLNKQWMTYKKIFPPSVHGRSPLKNNLEIHISLFQSMYLCHGQSPYRYIIIILISGEFGSVGLVKHKKIVILILGK